MRYLQVFLILFVGHTASTTKVTELRAIQSLLSFPGGSVYTSSGGGNKINTSQVPTIADLGQSRGVCGYDFIDLVTYRFDGECALDDYTILHLLPKRAVAGIQKPPIMVKCLSLAEATDGINASNGSTISNQLQLIDSIKDVVALLKPIGNATKRQQAGSCVLIFFYTETSVGCSLVAPYANKLPRLFPNLRVAAIDAYKFPSFNTEFGIVGLPTLLLFHQGRPMVKFYSDEGTYGSFVTRHTGIRATDLNDSEKVLGPLPLVPVQKTDYYLVLAWSFIFVCLGNYFAKTHLYQQIVEMIKRNWRESEAQLEQS